MAIHYVSPARIGQLAGHVRHAVGQIDKGIRFGSAVYKAVKPHLPPSKIGKAAEKGLSDYEAVREKIRNATNP